MKQNMIIVGGSKGGVGKSMVSLALLDFYLERGKKFVFVETDTSNPDVGMNYQAALGERMRTAALDTKDGWLQLIDNIEAADGADLIVNTGARTNDGIARFGGMVNDLARDGLFALITLWPINRQIDSVRLLKNYMATMSESEIFVLKNLYFGTPEKFELYDHSNTKKIIDEKWRDFDFPNLADRVSDIIITDRMTIAEAMTMMTLGNRVELKRWRDACAEIFKTIFGE